MGGHAFGPKVVIQEWCPTRAHAKRIPFQELVFMLWLWSMAVEWAILHELKCIRASGTRRQRKGPTASDNPVVHRPFAHRTIARLIRRGCEGSYAPFGHRLFMVHASRTRSEVFLVSCGAPLYGARCERGETRGHLNADRVQRTAYMSLCHCQ
ncbi:hypothetical protein BC826DRAFT_1035325 [Russula brevipes]|nr:hypothetical protein BC826DRAFT_1035325 [Russula brevipes]